MEYTAKRGRLYEGGNERVRYRLEYPVIENCEKINAFCEKIIENCEKYCREELYADACRERQKYLYELEFSVTHCDGTAVSVLMRARLSAGRELYREFVKAMTWDARTQLMIPPKILRKRYGKKGEKFSKVDALFLKGGRLQSVERERDNIFSRKR